MRRRRFVPLAILALAFAALPAAWVVFVGRDRRRRRRRRVWATATGNSETGGGPDCLPDSSEPEMRKYRPARRIAGAVGGVYLATSLVLSAAVVSLWVRSYASHRFAVAVAMEDGRFVSAWQRSYSNDLEFATVAPWPHAGIWLFTFDGEIVLTLTGTTALPGEAQEWEALGVGYQRDYGLPEAVSVRTRDGRSDAESWSPASTPVAYRHLSVPCWMAVSVLVGPPALWFGRRRVQHWRRARRWRRLERPCPNCGYDLRASPERCPECGAANGGSTTDPY